MINVFQTHNFLKMETIRTGMANSTPLEMGATNLSQVSKIATKLKTIQLEGREGE